MLVSIRTKALNETKVWEYVVRFVFGGLATALAGLVSHKGGPFAGGLFLAFPVIFCASATMIERHEWKRKADRGLEGKRRGKLAAALDSVGALLGSIGLVAFGSIVWLLGESGAITAIATALTSWLVLSVTLWWCRRYIRRTSLR